MKDAKLKISWLLIFAKLERKSLFCTSSICNKLIFWNNVVLSCEAKVLNYQSTEDEQSHYIRYTVNELLIKNCNSDHFYTIQSGFILLSLYNSFLSMETHIGKVAEA